MNAIILSAIWGVIMMFGGVFFKNRTSPKYAAILGILMLIIGNCFEYQGSLVFAVDSHSMFVFDHFGLVFNAIAFGCTLIYFLLNGSEIEKVGKNVSEFYALIFFVLCGVAIASSFKTLLMLFLGIEIMSIPLYILTGSDKTDLKGNEASLKYFLMGAFSTGIMLMGIAFVYGGNAMGSFSIDNIQLGAGTLPTLIAIGLVLILVSMSFKVSAVPFHFWTPDVYDGAPTVFTSFMATIVKAAAFIAFIRLFQYSFGNMQSQWQLLITLITAATLFVGNITAVFQQSVKRMLAYSSIAQAGFMMLAIFALNDTAKEGLILYTLGYSLASIGMFAVLVKLSDYTIEGFNGLGKKSPVLAFCATIFLLSLTGIPLTAGFTSKFYMLLAAVKEGHQFWIVIIAVLCAAISAYYYFRIIQAMYFKSATDESKVAVVSGGFEIMLIITAALIILFGVLPGLITGWLYI